MAPSWITRHPQHYAEERQSLAYHYPSLPVHEAALRSGVLALSGELVVRPPGGAQRHPVVLWYPSGTPYEQPKVFVVEKLPKGVDEGDLGASLSRPRLLDHRHQMPDGSLCLFQRETRGADIIRGVDVLRRAEQWLTGMHTKHWPPDTQQSELESHFPYAGDVLVAAPFFADEIHGHGRLLFTQDIRRCRINPDEKSFPLILTALTMEAGAVIRTVDARPDLSRLYPWIGEKAWEPYPLAAADEPGSIEDGYLVHGYWWSLSDEPAPFHRGETLLRMLGLSVAGGDAWSLVDALMGSDVSSEKPCILGLRYPARNKGWEWLIFVLERAAKRGRRVPIVRERRAVFEESYVSGAMHVHRLEPEALRLRNRGVVDEKEISSKTVALIGLGALGSKVAEMLAQAGIGRFRLCDSDVLMTGNVARHIGGVTDYGARKTRVVMGRLFEINPYLAFGQEDIFDGSAVGDIDRLAAFIGAADLVVSTMADESAESVLNEIAILERKPVVYGRSLREASTGRVFLVRPGIDACKRCLSDYAFIRRKGGDVPSDWIDVPEDTTRPLLHECGRPVIAGSAVDLSFIASLAARVALDFLEGNASQANHWLWSRRSAGEIDGRLALPMSTFIGRLPRRKGCAVCQEPQVSEILVAKDAYEKITSLTEESPDTETGGVLIGFVDDTSRAVIVAATGPGPNAVRTSRRMNRDVPYVQRQLEEAAAELGHQGNYMGEWHSHLSPDTQPSPLDIESLFGIAEAPNYLTRSPVMLVLGVGKDKKVDNMSSWVFEPGGRMHDIPYKLASREEAFALAPTAPDV